MHTLNIVDSEDYWLYLSNVVYHGEQEQLLDISTNDLKDGDSIGLCITRDGDLEIYINGQKRAVGWHNVPTDKPLWGVLDIWGQPIAIQSEFYCGELYSSHWGYMQCVKHTYSMCYPVYCVCLTIYLVPIPSTIVVL